MNTKFSDRGLTFNPIPHPDYGTFQYEYNGKNFETWQVTLENGASIGVFSWQVGTYKTRKALSENFDGERRVICGI